MGPYSMNGTDVGLSSTQQVAGFFVDLKMHNSEHDLSQVRGKFWVAPEEITIDGKEVDANKPDEDMAGNDIALKDGVLEMPGEV